MEPVKTHGAILPQQALTHSAGGCPSGPRPEDLMQEGHEGANPHAGQRVATVHTLTPPGVSAVILGDECVLSKRVINLTRLEVFQLLEKTARLRGPKVRPLDLTLNERTTIIMDAIYPRDMLNHINKHSSTYKNTISKFTSKCEQLYKNCYRKRHLFIKKNKAWLSAPFDLGILDVHDKNIMVQEPLSPIMPSTSGLSCSSQVPIIHTEAYLKQEESKALQNIPTASTIHKTYNNLSNRHKYCEQEKLGELLKDQPQSKIIKVLSNIATTESGQKLSKGTSKHFEQVINECLKTPTRPKKLANLMKSRKQGKPQQPYTTDEALALIIDRKLTVEDYKSMQQDLKKRGFNAYPPYYKVNIAKKLCYPDEEIKVTDREASLSLQGLLMHTFRRIVDTCGKQFEQNENDFIHLNFEVSWGFDGSTGQSLYKQKFTDDEEDNENCLFTTSIIPLRIRSDDGFVFWCNPHPQSFRYCRPLRIQYRSESKTLILSEKQHVEDEINNLSLIYAETKSGCSIIAHPKLYLTIIDGKVYNIITNTSSQLRCACCGATVKEFNKLEIIANKPVNQKALLHGLSPLHAWIRLFEFLLHLGYKNDPAVKKWRIMKNSPEARIVAERKKRIQAEIRNQMSLLVDVVRPNSGTTNDGNTARTALSNLNRHTFADILGLEFWLVDSIHTILVALSCCLPIDTEKFQLYCSDLAAKYVETYGWNYMSVTLHKILMHGGQIIRSSALPIGMLSEQAGESRNKYWRYDREHHTRKFDRKTTILDLFHRALESSDPYVTMLSSRKQNRKRLAVPDKVLSLLKPQIDNTNMPTEVDVSDIILTNDEILICSDDELDMEMT